MAEYELTLNHAKELRNPNLTDLADMKRRIQELKGEIRALGNVNVNAIEEYKSVSERYEFLKGQHDDLVEAAETLEQIIEELDNAMRKQFKEQFARIAAEFDQVFKEMFGGGKGTLELMEDEDILEVFIKFQVFESALSDAYRVGEETDRHQLLGHPLWIQTQACEIDKEQILLLQLDSDDHEDGPGWMWGDAGRIYFTIKPEDLAACRFDNAEMTLECY